MIQDQIGYGWTLDSARTAMQNFHNSMRKTHQVLKFTQQCMTFIMDQGTSMDITHLTKFVWLNLFAIHPFHSCLLFHRSICLISREVEFLEWVPMMTKIIEEIFLFSKWRKRMLLTRLFFLFTLICITIHQKLLSVVSI